MARSNLKDTFSRHKKWLVAGLLIPATAWAVFYPYVQVDNITLDGNTISTSNTDGDLILDANGTGSILFTDLTATTVPYLDASKQLVSSAVTPTQLGYLTGVTSAIQTQLDLKAPLSAPTLANPVFTGTITTPLTASKALVTNASSQLATSAVTGTELGYVAGVTSAIQTQLDSKAAASAVGDASNQLNNITFTATVAANALTFALKTKDGGDPAVGDPVYIGFRSTTITSGLYFQRSVTGALSLTISSGSTLGMTNGVADYVYLYAIDNAGTVELAASSATIDEGRHIDTTAEAGNADAWAELYSIAARTDAPVRMIGRIRISEATAGTWATAPSELALMPFDGVKLITTALQAEDSATRIEHAIIDCDASSGVTGNTTQTWITSVDNISAGACTINFRTNMFDASPSCTVSDMTGASADPYAVGITSISGSAITVDCSTNSGTDCTDYDFSIICIGQAKTN